MIARAREIIRSIRLGIKYNHYHNKNFVAAKTSQFELLFDTHYTDNVGRVLSLRKRLQTGQYERDFLKFCFEHIREDETIVEIGTWIGNYSVLLGKYMAPKGTVFGFEPDPVAFRQCIINLSLNNLSNVFVYPLAISDTTGFVTLYTNRAFGNSGSSILESNPVEDGSLQNGIKVPCVSLDRFLPTLQVTPATIKIDIEGAEDLALAGACDTIGRENVKILLEIHHDYLARRGKSANTVLRQLADTGKTIYFLENIKNSPYRIGEKVDPLRPIDLPIFHVAAF